MALGSTRSARWGAEQESQHIVQRGSTNSVRFRRAMMTLVAADCARQTRSSDPGFLGNV